MRVLIILMILFTQKGLYDLGCYTAFYIIDYNTIRMKSTMKLNEIPY